MNRRRLVAVAAAVATAALVVVPIAVAHAGSGLFDVHSYGATGNGTTFDDDAIDAAITDAASNGGGGTVVFPAGTYLSRTIHLKSNVTLRLDSGATVLAASSGMDAPEPNSFDQYQDFGHSHFHNALMWGDGVTNVAITGTGTIDGDGLATSNVVPSGQGDKILSLKLCSNISLSGVTFRRGGHFAVLMNGCHDVAVDNLHVLTSTDRDAMNIINTWNVDITNSRIEGRDDAVVLKSDFALGRTFVSQNIKVHDSTILSTENNAIQFGSETCGDFRDVHWDRLTLLGGGKAVIGIVSMDGATIENVTYNDITMTKAATPIFIKIGNRGRCPGTPPAGHIRNVSLTNISGTVLHHPESTAEYTSTISGTTVNDVENVTLTNVNLTVPGGHPAADATIVPPEQDIDYTPKAYGTRPSYGFWVRHASGIRFVGCSFRVDTNDDRPTFVTDDASNTALDGVTVQRGTASPYDVGFSGVNGYRASGSTTTGSALRIRATGSTPLPATFTTVRAEAESGTVSAPMQILSDPAASGGRYVSVTPGSNSTGAPPTSGFATVPFTVSTAGAYRIWGRVIDPTTSDDSFWVRVDGGSWVNWNNIPPGTGWHWDDVHNAAAANSTVTYSLAAGAHTVDFAYREDGAKLDRVLVTNDPFLVPADSAPPVRYEAESAVISQGVVATNHLNYSGTGFVDYTNVAGSYVEWTVTAAGAGPATLTFRHANGSTANRPMDISVGGTVVAPGLAFNPTGSWDTWAGVTITATLTAGTNVIRATATTAAGGPNVDYLEVQS
jgi:hypothetical protein